MNILFISNYSSYSKGRFGGAETSMRLLAEHLVEKGHRAVFLTKDKRRGLLPQLVKKNVKGVRIIIFRKMRGRLGIIKVINEVFFKYQVKKVIRQHGIEIVYCPYQPSIIQLLIRLRNITTNFKIVLRLAGMLWYERCLKKPGFSREYERLFNSIDGVNYVHRDLEQMTDQKFSELKMNVNFKYSFTADIGSCLSPGRPQPYTELNNRVFKIIMASRFSDYQKRQDIIVHAVSMINSEIGIEVKLIGNGERRDIIQEIIDQLAVSDRIKIIPFMEQQKLWQELSQADLLCHACDYEGTSKIILESMALGLPVLASNVRPVNDYVIDGYNGFLVNNDPVLWADKITALINDKAAREQVSIQAMNYIMEHYNPIKNVSLYEHNFYEILKMN